MKYKILLAILLSSFSFVFASTSTYYGTPTGTASTSDNSIASGYKPTISDAHNTVIGEGTQGVSSVEMSIRALRNGSGYYLNRSFVGFDVSDLAGKTVTSASLVLFKSSSYYINNTGGGVVITNFTATSTNPTANDFGQFGFVQYSDQIARADFVTNTAHTIPLSVTGSYTNIITGISGAIAFNQALRLGIVTSEDFFETSFTSGEDNILYFHSADEGGSKVPYLVVTWTTGGSSGTTTISGYSTSTPFSASSTAIFANCTASSTWTSPNIGCFVAAAINYVFVPNASDMDALLSQGVNYLTTRFPIGYITDTVTILSTTTTSTLTVLDITVPPYLNLGNGNLRFDLSHSLDYVLYATSSKFTGSGASTTMTLLAYTQPIWQKIMYLSVVLYLIWRIFGIPMPEIFRKREYEGVKYDYGRKN